MADYKEHISQDFGWIEVICGCMFSGKTEALLERINYIRNKSLKIGVFKSAVDTRYDKSKIVSHQKNQTDAIPLNNIIDIYNFSDKLDFIAVDEVQFFDENIVDVVVKLANDGKKIFLSGLDMDFKGNPFGAVPHLLAVADNVVKLHAKCSHSGLIASFSKRITLSDEQIVLGENNIYQPRNRNYFNY